MYFFLYPPNVFLQSITNIAFLGLLHSSDVFSEIVNLFLEPSFPWWSLCFIFCVIQLFSVCLSILAPDNLTVATVASYMVLCNSKKLVRLYFKYSGSISCFTVVMMVASFLEHFVWVSDILLLGLFLQILLVPCKILFLFCLVLGFLQSVGFHYYYYY